jgi:hypothetical protein
MKICPKCNTCNEDNNVFCKDCNEPLSSIESRSLEKICEIEKSIHKKEVKNNRLFKRILLSVYIIIFASLFILELKYDYKPYRICLLMIFLALLAYLEIFHFDTLFKIKKFLNLYDIVEPDWIDAGSKLVGYILLLIAVILPCTRLIGTFSIRILYL